MFRRSLHLAVPLAFTLVAAMTTMIGCKSDPASPPGSPADTTPPTVLTIDPADAAVDVPLSSPVTVVFSEPMDPASLADTAYSLSDSSGPVAGSASLIGSTLTITPDLDLTYSTDYLVTVGTELTDLAGNALAAPVASGFTTLPAPSPVRAGVRYVGRFDDADPNAVRLSWSGSGFVVRFHGTRARATLRGGRYFTVVVDGVVQPAPLAVSESDATYDLAANLADGEHTIEVYRRTEGFFGPTVVSSVEVYGEPLVVPEPTRQVEVVGDSWSTGHGVDGPGPGCAFSAENENHFVTWGAIAARAFGAELSTVAYGGKGIVRDFNGDLNEQMPTLYERVVATEDGSGGTIRPVDAVLVSLGANDFISGQLPSGFVAAYASFLEQIRTRHPDALIACVWPQLDDPLETQRARTAIDAAIAERATAGDTRVMGADLELEALVDFGCEYHPGPLTHALMAEKTTTFLSDELGWESTPSGPANNSAPGLRLPDPILAAPRAAGVQSATR